LSEIEHREGRGLALAADRGLEPTPLRHYVEVLRRHKWTFALIALVVPVAAVVLSLRGEPLYAAHAQVLLSEQNLGGELTGGQSPPADDPDRVAATQARVARTPELARRVLRATGLESMTVGELLHASNVAPIPATDILDFSVVDSTPSVAERLATTYAQQFARYSRELETAAIDRAYNDVVAEMSRVAKQNGRDSTLYLRLSQDARALRTMAALRASKAQLLRRAEGTEQIEPRPARTAAFGLFAGLLLAVALVALLEALDTRVRSESEVADALKIPLLGRLPEVSRRFRHGGLVMLDEPEGKNAESFRIVRSNLEYVNAVRRAQTIMFTSSVRGEDKSSTTANLALTFARLGRRVILVDLDFREASVHRLFGLDTTIGVSDVVLRNVALEHAIVRIQVAPRGEARASRWTPSTSREAELAIASDGLDGHAALDVLPAGAAPADPGEFVGMSGIADVLQSLRERADIVLVDAPPLLEVSDPMTVMRQVDALVITTRLGVVRRPMLKELRRMLETSSVSALGFIVTGERTAEDYRRDYHGQGASVTRRRPRVSLVGRALRRGSPRSGRHLRHDTGEQSRAAE
jgi:succinoglycan biosynthesis transport protein ExoP